VSRLFSPGAWRYWSGVDWDEDPASAAWVFDGPSAPDVEWNEHLGEFVNVSSIALRDRIVVQTGPTPMGPWTTRAAFASHQGLVRGLTYQAIQHPEAQRDGGARILITYYRRTGACRGDIHRAELSV
jgi:hypothetical protein